MFETVSLHSEQLDEDGRAISIAYKLTETRRGGETRYGILCYTEGKQPDGRDEALLPEIFVSRGVCEGLLRFMAERGVSPVHMEDLLGELLY